ncbi:MAG TPA: isoprenylcysteine carboxylmethyltransferase family protein, partial [Gemmatimonadales bacterium]|nr:isoprenylcysteine carboxylmethyltransferase family protein [Gemmatimonadales bacterium]
GLTLAPTVRAYLAVVTAVALLRFAELAISARHRRALAAGGATAVHEPHFKWMALLHTAILAGAALEVVALHRPFLPALAAPALGLLIAATWTRWWVIQTLGQHWNVGVMDSTRQGVVDAGPYRWVRHPNYTAVFVELLALPLVHTAWITAVLGSLAHVFVLRARVAAEDRVLLASPDYAARMAAKPAFLPTRPTRPTSP